MQVGKAERKGLDLPDARGGRNACTASPGIRALSPTPYGDQEGKKENGIIC